MLKSVLIAIPTFSVLTRVEGDYTWQKLAPGELRTGNWEWHVDKGVERLLDIP